MEHFLPPAPTAEMVEEELSASERLVDCADALLTSANIEDALLCLQNSQTQLEHLAKLADLQIIHHGLPRGDDPRPPVVLSPEIEGLQAFTQLLTAFFIDRNWSDAHLAALDGFDATSSHDVYSSSTEATVPLSSESACLTAGAISASRATDSVGASAASEGAALASDSPSTSGASASVGISASVGDVLPAHTKAASKSKWSTAEVEMFNKGLALFTEFNQVKIAAYMGTRNAVQVRERVKRMRRAAGKSPKSTGPAHNADDGTAQANATVAAAAESDSLALSDVSLALPDDSLALPDDSQ